MIGVFDSGYGGLSVFKEIEKKLPQYNYIYLGDNARAPYGDLSQDLIYQYSRQAVDYLFFQNCQLIIFACNTASAMALRKIQQEYLPDRYPNRNVLGVIRPLVEATLELDKKSKVGIMATASTVDSRAYVNEFLNLDKNISIWQQACPLLVPLIEASRENSPETDIVLTEYTKSLTNLELDALILGCTHYSWLHNKISNRFGPRVQIIDSGKIIADKLRDYINRHPHYDQPEASPQRIFLTTGDNYVFDRAADKFLGRQIKSLKINLN